MEQRLKQSKYSYETVILGCLLFSLLRISYSQQRPNEIRDIGFMGAGLTRYKGLVLLILPKLKNEESMAVMILSTSLTGRILRVEMWLNDLILLELMLFSGFVYGSGALVLFFYFEYCFVLMD